MNDYSDFSKKFYALLGPANSILVTSHIDPDDDAMASVLSIYFILSQKYPDKNIDIKFSSEIDARWGYFENINKVQSAQDITDTLSQYGAVIFLDANYAERFTRRPGSLAEYKGVRICIDHHGSKPMDFNLSLIEPKAVSTAELIYFGLAASEQKLNPRLCEILLMGVMSDTGSFRFVPPSESRIFEMAKRLVDDGQIDINDLRTKYSGLSANVYEVFKELVKNSRLETIAPWPPVITSFISEDFSKNFSYLEIDDATAEFTKYLTFVKEAHWGMVSRPSGDRVKVSMRAKPGNLNVRKIAEAMGKGSGHDLAAGMKFDGTKDAESVLSEVKTWLQTHNVI